MGDDKRYYIFRYITCKNSWGYIALNDTDCEGCGDVTYDSKEVWTCGDNGARYDLYNVMYSQTKVVSMIDEADSKSDIENAMAMRGPDIFILTDVDKNVLCTVWKPLVTKNTIEIDCHRGGGGIMSVDEQIPFDELTGHIKRMLKLNFTSVEIDSTFTHCV
jgi:hypothetical protein